MSMDGYLLIKALHVVGFSAWMAGMWYLPRLMVYHADATRDAEPSNTLKLMERRLLRTITNPAMLITLALGITLAVSGGHFTEGWLHAKLLLVAGMLACHGILAGHVRRFGNDERPWPSRRYRWFNEIPTVLFIGIVVLAVWKPF